MFDRLLFTLNPSTLCCCVHDGWCCRAGALDALLLPQRQHSAGPRDRALHAAVSTARLAQLLLTLMEEVPEELVMSLPPNEKILQTMVHFI